MKGIFSVRIGLFLILQISSFLFTLDVFSQKITEICPSNKSNYNHPIEGFSDWIELYNPTSNNINLEGYYFVDNNSLSKKWTFHDTILLAGSYMVIPANVNTSSIRTINFNFSKGGGAVTLFSNQSKLVDSINYPKMQVDHSYSKSGFYYDQPTPNNSNQMSTGYKGYAEKPEIRVIDQKDGLKTIRLASKHDEAIFYSLNGSNPINGDKYTEPITSSENISIVAVTLVDSFLPSYFLFYSVFPKRPDNLPIVNLTVDSLALFDDITGLYLPGPNASSEWPFYGANFWRDTEVEAYFSYYNNQGQLREERQCVLKIHGGNGSRTKSMKPLQLIIKNYHEEKTFDYPYFVGKPRNSYSKIILRNSGNDFDASMMKDGLIHDYIKLNNLDVDVLGYHPAVVFVNGHYLGIHNIREKVGVDYIEANYREEGEINILENDYLSVLNGSATSFNKIVNYVNSHGLNNEANYKWVAERLDVNSMVDYFIAELFIYNRDWPSNNVKLWNSTNHPKWRYLCFDLDVSLSYFWGSDLPEKRHYLKYLLEELSIENVHVKLFKKFMGNSEFKRYFINRYADLLNTIFEPNRFKKYVYDKKKHIEADMEKHCQKWNQPYDNWHKNVFYLIAFLDERSAFVFQELSNTFNKPPPVDIELKIYPYRAGEIQLNSIRLDTFPFYGKYYSKNKIDLEAIPNPGHDFKYWLNNRTGEKFTQSGIQVDPAQSDEYVAVFSALEDDFNLLVYPNPFNNQVKVNFSVREPTKLSIRLFDLSGRLIQTIEKETFYLPGVYETPAFLDKILPGTYTLSLKSTLGTSAISIVKL